MEYFQILGRIGKVARGSGLVLGQGLCPRNLEGSLA